MSKNARPDSERVVVTGMGIITANADCVVGYDNALRAGLSGITRWSDMDERIYSKIGGDLFQFNYLTHLEKYGHLYPAETVKRAKKLLKNTPLPGRLTAMAALEAYYHAGLNDTHLQPERMGHILGGHNLNAKYIYDNTLEFINEPEYIDPLYGMYALDNDVLSVASELLQLQGPSYMVGGACASSNLAMISALDALRLNRADVILLSGAADGLDPVCLQGWSIMESLSIKSFNDQPERASRPFDRLREGFVPGQAAACVVLERYDVAKKRGAPMLAELLGGAATSDGSRLTRPDKNGQVRAMNLAIADAHIEKEWITYVNAHATSTQLGDSIEVEAIKESFGAHAYQLAVNSTKSMIGHCLLAASCVEFIATVLQMQGSYVHPTINQEEPDPALDLNFVPNVAQARTIHFALSNSFGFGGLNSAVIIGRAP